MNARRTALKNAAKDVAAANAKRAQRAAKAADRFNIKVNMGDGIAEARLVAGSTTEFPNGSRKATAILHNGHFIRVSKTPKATAWKFEGVVQG